MHRRFKRNINSLDNIFEFIAEFTKQHHLDESIKFAINIALEELFTNVLKYSSGSSKDILITLSKSENTLILTLTEFDAELFDINQASSYNHTQSLEERPIGGIGLHLVRKFMDKIDYDYKNKQSKITLIKHLGETNV